MLADSLRTDRHAFRRLSVDEPVIVERREWSRMTDDPGLRRGRLCSANAAVWPTVCASSCGAITRRCWSSPTTWRPSGFSICGTRRRARRRRLGCARRRSSESSKRTAFAVGRPPRCCASCARSRCRWLPGWPRLRPLISRRWPPASGSSISSSRPRTASWTSSATSSSRPRRARRGSAASSATW